MHPEWISYSIIYSFRQCNLFIVLMFPLMRFESHVSYSALCCLTFELVLFEILFPLYSHTDLLIRKGSETMWQSHERKGWGIITNKGAALVESHCTVCVTERGLSACKGPARATPCVPPILNICNEQYYSAPWNQRWGWDTQLCAGATFSLHHHWNSCSCGKWVGWRRTISVE